MTARPRILVVEDEVALLNTLRLTLDRQGFDVETVETGTDALAALQRWHPDVILLDQGLPDIDGVEVVRQTRALGFATRIVVLSARGSDRDKVLALDLGADDYLTKPFSVPELVARLKVALRHLGPPSASNIHSFDDLSIDYARRVVTAQGREVKLSPTEWELLKTLVSMPDRVLTYRTLLQKVWGPAYGEEEHYLHVYVANIRKKIEANPRTPKHIITEAGVGY
ncbi:MAG TPA: response regulator transcription factor, partial [Chloroflexota bacterium]|nr:response regulator transcription factor [Chloroflexota bacterium]